MLANASHDVAVLAGGVADFLVGDACRSQLVLRIDREHHQSDLSFAVVGDGFRDRRALAGLEVFRGRVFVFLPNFIHRLPARHLGMRVHIDRK